MSSDIFLTKSGLAKLKKELKGLTEVKRVEVSQRIKDAREMGDISENSAYDSAREEQSFVEGRISELEDILKNAKVAEGAKGGEVAVGARVTVHIEGDEETFHIVGAPEANPMENKISHESPLGLQLLGRKVGDKLDVEAPIGTLTYTVLRIE